MATTLPAAFVSKKSRILCRLSVPVSDYDDLSPKGSIDVGIRELIDEINGVEGCVTTSSCAGRVSVFLEGRKSAVGGGEEAHDGEGEGEGGGGWERSDVKAVGVGGKGNGGRWLFVSHDPIEIQGCGGEGSWVALMGMARLEGGEEELLRELGTVTERRLVHFRFEPMILHVLTASLHHAQAVLSAALQAGFRESGALNLTSSTSEPPTPMVGIRSMGLALESVIGFASGGKGICVVPEWQLRSLIEISNQRFQENAKRIARFRTLLRAERSTEGKRKGQEGVKWEDAGERRERKRAEGLERARVMRETGARELRVGAGDVPDICTSERTS
ncbi:tRNA wybutosine-synthesizing protein [Diplocarpon mali]|nr:tRNA wybutosine-synthesizing protein [Diplocarpon mali]